MSEDNIAMLSFTPKKIVDLGLTVPLFFQFIYPRLPGLPQPQTERAHLLAFLEAKDGSNVFGLPPTKFTWARRVIGACMFATGLWIAASGTKEMAKFDQVPPHGSRVTRMVDSVESDCRYYNSQALQMQ